MEITVFTQIIANLATVVAAFTGIVAAVFVVFQTKGMKQSREVDIFLKIHNMTMTKEFIDAENLIKLQINEKTTYEQAYETEEIRKSMTLIRNYFEMIGVLIDGKYISKNIIYDQMGSWILGTWGKLERFIKEHRIKRQNLQYAENFELLFMGYKEWADKTPLKLDKRPRGSSEEIKEFYKK